MPKTKHVLLSETKANELKTRMQKAGMTGVDLTNMYSKNYERLSQQTISGTLARRIVCSVERLSRFEKLIRNFEKIHKYAEKING
jgi:hypothetical protein